MVSDGKPTVWITKLITRRVLWYSWLVNFGSAPTMALSVLLESFIFISFTCAFLFAVLLWSKIRLWFQQKTAIHHLPLFIKQHFQNISAHYNIFPNAMLFSKLRRTVNATRVSYLKLLSVSKHGRLCKVQNNKWSNRTVSPTARTLSSQGCHKIPPKQPTVPVHPNTS